MTEISVTPASATRTAVVAGATGLVGRLLTERLCADPAVQAVHALVRREPGWTHPKLRVHVVRFDALPTLPATDEVYLALGTTIALAGSQAAFRAVDLDANLAVAQAALAAGVRRLGLVSAMGADAHSRIFYSRVKGELEAALAAMPWRTLVIAQPSLIEGDRRALGQPRRPGEGRWSRVEALLRPLLPRNWRAVAASDVAAALADAVPRMEGRRVLSSAAMQGAAARTETQE